MDWQQKFEAINALCEASLLMREPDDWYVRQNVEIRTGGMLERRYGNGSSPEDAILDHWEHLTDLEDDEYIVINAYRDTRLAVRWNGYLWAVVKESNSSTKEV